MMVIFMTPIMNVATKTGARNPHIDTPEALMITNSLLLLTRQNVIIAEIMITNGKIKSMVSGNLVMPICSKNQNDVLGVEAARLSNSIISNTKTIPNAATITPKNVRVSCFIR